MQLKVVAAKIETLDKRLALLRRGADVDQPRKLHASRVTIARKKLGLPSKFRRPSKQAAGAMARLLAARLKRKQGEKDADFKHRVRAYLQRSLTRYVSKKDVEKLSDAPAINAAVMETLSEDRLAIEAELRAGGIAQDFVAESMEPIVMDVMPVIDNIVVDVQPEMEPTGDINDIDLTDLVMEAEGEAAVLANSTDTDEFDSEESPIYTNPYFIGGSVVVAGGLIYLVMRGRS